MKKFIKYLACILGISVLFINMVFFGIVLTPKDTFRSSYQSVIQDKFRILKETNEPKIIMVSGSSSAFGLDQKMLENATGYKVANLGLHAGFGKVFYTELSKANIKKGDIVLLGYEGGWNVSGGFDSIGADLVMSGIDNHVGMYRYLPLRIWPQILGYTFRYAATKKAFTPATGIYSREAFDFTNAQMDYPREDMARSYRKAPDDYGKINIEPTISNDVKKYLIKYKKYVESRGAKIYFVSSPKLREAIYCDFTNFDKLRENEEKEIGIPYISNDLDYIMPEILMTSDPNHCNERGQEYRTKQLIHDLVHAGAVLVKKPEKYELTKDEKLDFEDDILKYLKEIDDPDYVVFMSALDDASSAITDEIQEELSDLGVKIDLRGKYQNSFYAVLDNGKSVEDYNPSKVVTTTGMIKEAGGPYSVSSAGYGQADTDSIIINGLEYSMHGRGLNIVVFRKSSKKVVDSVCFDTCKGLTCTR